MIQVRNVPEWLHEELKRRADRQGQTLTAYIQGILEREAATLPLEDWLERTLELGVEGDTSGGQDPSASEPESGSAETIRQAREERTEALLRALRRR